MRRTLALIGLMLFAGMVVEAQPVKDVGGGIRLEVGKNQAVALSDSGKLISVRVVSEEKSLAIEDRGDFLLCGLPEGKEVSIEVEVGKGVKPSQKAGEWLQVVEWTRGSEKCRLLLDGRLKLTETKTGYVLGPFTGKELALAVKGGEAKLGLLYGHVEGGERIWNGKGPVQWEVYAVGCDYHEWSAQARHSATTALMELASFSYQPVKAAEKDILAWGRGCKAIRYVPIGNSHMSDEPDFQFTCMNGTKSTVACGSVVAPAVKVVAGPCPSKANRRYYERDGQRFYPIGKNVAWQGDPLKDYAKVFADMRRAGENTCRIWSASWHIPLVTGDPKDGFDPVNAYIWDELFRMAFEEGIYLMPVLDNAYDMTKNAAKHPLFAAAGVKNVADYMKSESGRRVLWRYFAEALARYWAVPSLLTVEIVNEPDLALLQDVSLGMRSAMAKVVFLPWALDALGINRSFASSGAMNLPNFYWSRTTMGLWDVNLVRGDRIREPCGQFEPHIFMPPEAEIKDLAEFSAADLVSSQVHTALGATKGPVIVGEFGYRPPTGDANAPDASANHADKEGIALRDALWVSIASGASGPVLPWWWDTHIAKYGLDKRITAVSKFLSKVDLAPLCEKAIQAPAGMEVKMYGMRGRGGAFLMLLDPKASVQNRTAGKLTETRKGLTLSLPGMSPSRYMVRFWDLDSGEVVSEYDQNASADGWVFLTVPEFREGIAVTAIALAAGG